MFKFRVKVRDLSAISCETSSTFLFMCIECAPAIIKKKSINRDDTLLIDNEILFNLFSS